MHVVILAGGVGSRLWPLSRDDFPKQFLRFAGRDSLLKQTVLRFLNQPFIRTIVISTNHAFDQLVRKELEGLNVSILVEPCGKGTGPAIGFAIRHLEECFSIESDEPILFLPSDHLIDPLDVFFDYLKHGQEIARKGQIVTFGIRPTKPETGYGYIQAGERFDSHSYRVEQFIEKPDLVRAQEYCADPRFYWNSGMFIFTPAVFWSESLIHYPQITEKGDFHALEKISIDYALMEKTVNIVVCPLPVFWSDIGSWESVYEMLDKDSDQNVKLGNVVDIDSKNCLIMGGKRVISTIGLEDLVVIDTDDAILIARKGDSQRVRELAGKCGKFSS